MHAEPPLMLVAVGRERKPMGPEAKGRSALLVRSIRRLVRGALCSPVQEGPRAMAFPLRREEQPRKSMPALVGLGSERLRQQRWRRLQQRPDCWPGKAMVEHTQAAQSQRLGRLGQKTRTRLPFQPAFQRRFGPPPKRPHPHQDRRKPRPSKAGSSAFSERSWPCVRGPHQRPGPYR